VIICDDPITFQVVISLWGR